MSPVANPHRISAPWVLVWVLFWIVYNVVICFVGWTCWEGASFGKPVSMMIKLEPWEWWMEVIAVWGLANAAFALGPLIELIRPRQHVIVQWILGIFFFLVLYTSLPLIASWAMNLKTCYYIEGQSVPSRGWPQ
jgi:hypothetical protein